MEKAATILLLTLSTSLIAAPRDESQFYAGGTLGLSHYDEDGYFDNSALVGSSFDDDAFGFSLIGGYQLNHWLAVEANFTYLGTYWEEGKGDNDDDDIATTLSAATVGIHAALPLGEIVAVYVQAGVGFATVIQTIDYDIPGVNIEEDDEDWGPAGMLGVGFSVKLPAAPAVQIRTGYQYFSFEADLAKVDEFNQYVTEEIGQELDYFYLGAVYHF